VLKLGTAPASRILTGSAFVLLAVEVVSLTRAAIRDAVMMGGGRYYVLGDDAMISMRYAYNLAHGLGLVWNPGEYVQGITNLGWTLVMAGVHALGVPLEVAPLVVKLISVAILGVTAATLLLRLQPLAGFVAAALAATDGASLLWGLNGFETTLEAFLILLACLPFLDGRPATFSPIWAALAFVVRPDAIVVVAWASVLALMRRRSREMATALAGLLIVAGVFLFQKLYYGDWLPNTFHLKATHGAARIEQGLAYLAGSALGEFALLPLLLVPLVLVLFRRDLAMVCVLPTAWATYVVWVGGDAFCCARFFAPMVPTMAALAGLLTWELVKLRRWVVLAVVVAGLAWPVGLGVSLLRRGATQPVAQSIHGVCLAEIGKARVPRDSVIGVYFAGTVPYFMPEHRFHDFLGKSDRVIARSAAHRGPVGHNKWNYEYSLGQVAPSVIVTAAPFDSDDEAVYRSRLGLDFGFVPELWLHPLFRGGYRKVTVGCEGQWWTRHDVFVRP
jgi:hypothetical protein